MHGRTYIELRKDCHSKCAFVHCPTPAMLTRAHESARCTRSSCTGAGTSLTPSAIGVTNRALHGNPWKKVREVCGRDRALGARDTCVPCMTTQKTVCSSHQPHTVQNCPAHKLTTTTCTTLASLFKIALHLMPWSWKNHSYRIRCVK